MPDKVQNIKQSGDRKETTNKRLDELEKDLGKQERRGEINNKDVFMLGPDGEIPNQKETPPQTPEEPPPPPPPWQQELAEKRKELMLTKQIVAEMRELYNKGLIKGETLKAFQDRVVELEKQIDGIINSSAGN